MNQKSYTFEAEVSRLLEIVTHSLYSDREIFLRELISNAADACDRLRYESLTQEALKGIGTDFRITVRARKKEKTITLSDNGMGMDEKDLQENLGTIARSGTGKFIEHLKKNKEASATLIGQFGVGFYSAFMVAHKVEVITRKAGTQEAFKWTSEGTGTYQIDPAQKETHGTEVILHLKEDAEEFLEKMRLQHIIKTYSDFITLPIFLAVDAEKAEQVNAAKPLWTKAKKDISEKDYTDFYQTTAGAFDEPWETLHFNAEGLMNYTALLFIPKTRPYDLFDPKRQVSLKLYIRHVFITDACQELLPKYLRFVKGVVDSEDLSVNVSREILQQEPRLHKMRQALTNKVISALQMRQKKDLEAYRAFWGSFGPVLKEGLYEEPAEKDKLLPLCLFYSNKHGKLISLEDYVANLKENQKDIYFLSGQDLKTLKNNPHLEGFTARGLDVLLLTDPVDDFWTSMIGSYKEHKLVSTTSSSVDLTKFEEEGKKETEDETADISPLIAFIKTTLGKEVKDVRISKRLSSSPVCLVQEDDFMNPRLQQLLNQDQPLNTTETQTLEINPKHPLIQSMLTSLDQKEQQAFLVDKCWILLDEALIMEGLPVKDPQTFTQRLNRLLG